MPAVILEGFCPLKAGKQQVSSSACSNLAQLAAEVFAACLLLPPAG